MDCLHLKHPSYQFYDPGCWPEPCLAVSRALVHPLPSPMQTDDEKQRCVDQAAAEIEALARGQNPLAAQAVSNPNQATVYVGFEAPPEWGLAGKIRGASK